MGTLVNGIKEIFATAKTTGSNVMLCGNDGTPDGHMTMSNLASVLGVPKDYGRIYNSSFNIDTLINTDHEFSILEFGNANSISGTIPSGITGWATLLTICPYIEGTQFLCDETEKLFVRKSDDGIIGQWNEVGVNIPSFYKNYSSLASLAGAIGSNLRIHSGTISLASGESKNIENIRCGILIITDTLNNNYFDIAAIVVTSINSLRPQDANSGWKPAYNDTTTANSIVFYVSGNYVVCKNNNSDSVTFNYVLIGMN